MEDQVCLHCRIRGRVQGVFFRQSTRDKARELGLGGWVKNLPNGDVELLACGNKASLDVLQAWLWQGPPAARVQDVVVEAQAFEDFRDFRIDYS